MVLSRAEDTTQEEYELILQSLSSACPEKPELTGDNAEAIDYYLKIREVLATTYLYMGDGDTYIRMRDNNQRISEELKNIMNAA